MVAKKQVMVQVRAPYLVKAFLGTDFEGGELIKLDAKTAKDLLVTGAVEVVKEAYDIGGSMKEAGGVPRVDRFAAR
jgi:hypothetical protein